MYNHGDVLISPSPSLSLFFPQERVEFAMPDIVVDLVTKNRGGLNHEVLVICFVLHFLMSSTVQYHW